MAQKVIFFDSWKGGARHYQRLVEPLKKANMDCMLLHLGSWGNEKEFLPEETLKGLKVRDVSFYKGKDFGQILDIEKPDLVFFLSTATFAHRAFIRHSHLRKIPTIHSYHGIMRMQDIDNGATPYETNILQYALFAIQKVPKLLVKTFPCYIQSLYAAKAPIKDWGYFIKNVIGYITKPADQKIAPDAKTTLCMVYTNVDKPHAVEKYGFEPDEIIAVGNPDIIDFKLKLENKPQQNPAPSNKVVYIDTAFLAVGQFFNSNTEYQNHILDTQESLVKQGKTLCFKPHPACPIDLNKLKEKNIELLDNNNFVKELTTCCAAIAEPSSASIIPALMGIPVMLPKYGRFESLRFGHVLSSYPRSKYLFSVDDFNNLVNECHDEFDADKLEEWVAINSGPLPPEDMPKRVVEIFERTINESRRELPQ